MPLGSFNKKSQENYDQRVAATDNALVLQGGAFLFSPGPANTNETLAEVAPTVVNWNLVAMVAALAAVALGAFWWAWKRS